MYNNKINLVDLTAQYRTIRKEIDKAVSRVINKTDFIMGDEVSEFEKAYGKFLNVKFAIGVSSGTDALHLALKAIGIKSGDEVILPSHTFTATAEVIVWLGATPVFADIDKDTFTIDPKEISRLISKRTRVIIPVHLYGHPAPMDEIIEIAKKHKLYVVEDCAQSHGAKYKKRNTGTIGDIGCFSFYPGKNLGAYGDAGMVVTDDGDLAEKIKLLRNHGRLEKYTHEIVGYGNRLDTLQASILLEKLKHLKKWNNQRIKNASVYTGLLMNVKEVQIPVVTDWAVPVYHLYVIKAEKRDRLKEYLKSQNIETGIHYPLPLHLQPAYVYLGYKKGDLPHTEEVSRKILSLPLYPELTTDKIQYICQCIKDFFS